MNSFRVQFVLDKKTADRFNKVRDKSALISEALKWYFTYGKESLERLTRIESLLLTGAKVKEPEIKEIINNDIDDIFSEFTI